MVQWANNVDLLRLRCFAAMLVAMSGEERIIRSPFWFTAEGTLVGLVIGYVATRFDGEGRETVGR
jgi:hypothetical protein